MAKGQSASLDRKKLFADPVMITTIALLIVFLAVFILYPLAILLVDSVYSNEAGLTARFFSGIFGEGAFAVSFGKALFISLLGVLPALALGLKLAREGAGSRNGLFKAMPVLSLVLPVAAAAVYTDAVFDCRGGIARFLSRAFDGGLLSWILIGLVQVIVLTPLCFRIFDSAMRLAGLKSPRTRKSRRRCAKKC